MMGNFLTTLGNEPETDRAMFEELGLNVARQLDNAANPRPDNRSGWMSGETPDVVEELFADAARSVEETPTPAAEPDLNVHLWDPSTQLRFRAKRSVPRRPDGAPNRAPEDRRARERPPDREVEDATSPVGAG
jgi:biotin synthase